MIYFILNIQNRNIHKVRKQWLPWVGKDEGIEGDCLMAMSLLLE